MTFTEIVQEISERLGNLSADSTDRIERGVNRVYKAVTSSVGLVTSRRGNVTAERQAPDSDHRVGAACKV